MGALTMALLVIQTAGLYEQGVLVNDKGSVKDEIARLMSAA